MCKSLAVAVAFVFVAVVAQDYYYDSEICINVHPGLWRRDPQDCMVAHQCGFDGEITQSVKCNASQVWSKLASACVWEWDPDRDDCNGSPQVPIPRRRKQRIIAIHGQNLNGLNPMGKNPLGQNPFGKNPSGLNPSGLNPSGLNPSGLIPSGLNPSGINARGLNPSGLRHNDPRCVKKTGNNPDPDDCSRFIACANGTLIAVQRCGDGTLYWPQNNTCEFAQSIVHECGSRRIPETIIIREDDPLCRENGQAPDPTSCRHFILCQHGRRAQRIQCPHGTAFSETSRKCEWHHEVRCGNRN